MLMMRFQCPECGMGDYEVGHLVAEPVGPASSAWTGMAA